ncbi:hypothetical protein ACM7Q1_05905 [Paenibacillus illinoisensis]|uniref:hypothetical protein n=1 Tax=Paenibacillus illinoisensis TaxID=59845 RepID=UPI003A4E326A
MKFRKLRSVRTRLAASLLAMLLLPSLVIGGFSYFSAKNQVDTQLANGGYRHFISKQHG